MTDLDWKANHYHQAGVAWQGWKNKSTSIIFATDITTDGWWSHAQKLMTSAGHQHTRDYRINTHTYANLPFFWRICTTKDFPEMSDLRLLAAYIDPFLKMHWFKWNIIHLPSYSNAGISLNTESSLQRDGEIFQSTLHCHWFRQLSAHIIRSKPQPYIVKVLREF